LTGGRGVQDIILGWNGKNIKNSGFAKKNALRIKLSLKFTRQQIME